jgi:glycosyltransferase involved in cell wall biosynthesis
MKILLAYEWCLIGGVEAFMVALAQRLRAQGHDCEFFFFTRGPMEERLPVGFPAHFGDLPDCLKLLRSTRFDIVHANSSDWRIGISAVRQLGAKLVITAHGMVVPGWNSTNCDAFVCCSRWQAEQQKAFTDLPIHQVFNGIDLAEFRPSEDVSVGSDQKPIIAWVGRGTDMVHKKIDKLAAIAPALKEAGIRIWIADPHGPDEVEKIVPDAARTLTNAAEFWGLVPREKLAQFFRDVAATGGCVLSTSLREGLPMSLIEAEACGCPVIGTDVIGVNEVVDPAQGGVLYPYETKPEQLATLVIETLRDVKGMARRREACARFAHEKFSLERMAQDYERIYREALAPGQKSSRVMRARVALGPLLNWKDYVERRWTAGLALYEASAKLAAQQEWDLAADLAWLSFYTSPSIYLRPRRLAQLLRIVGPPPLFNSTKTVK